MKYACILHLSPQVLSMTVLVQGVQIVGKGTQNREKVPRTARENKCREVMERG